MSGLPPCKPEVRLGSERSPRPVLWFGDSSYGNLERVPCCFLSQQVPEVVPSLSPQVFRSARVFVQRKARSQGKCRAAWALAWAELSVGGVGGLSQDTMVRASQSNPRTPGRACWLCDLKNLRSLSKARK